MSKIICAACDCKWNDVHNRCRAKEIHLEDNHIMTAYDGRQHFWRCKQYEMDEETKKFINCWKEIFKNAEKVQDNFD